MSQGSAMMARIRRTGFLAAGILLLAMMTYTVIVGVFEIEQQVAMALMLLLPGAFLDRPAAKSDRLATERLIFLLDLVLALVALAAAGYMFFDFSAFYERTQAFSANGIDMAAGIALALVLLEGARRYIGLPLVILTSIFVLYAAFGSVLPGALQAPRFDLRSFSTSVLLGSNGVFGPALNVTATVIYAFILFGACLEAVGAGQYFMRFATAATKKSYGGPAKGAVVASSLMGTISGSAVANVATIGTVTIPLMKRAGYKAQVAAAIEAVASSGGQIMPPVMGATAFVISAYTGIPYGKVALHAAIPAFLFYVSVFLNVHFTALRDDIKPVGESAVMPWRREDIWGGFAVVLPLALLVYLLVTYYPTMLAGFYAAGAVVIATLPLKTTRLTWQRFVAAVTSLGRAMAVIAFACGAAGIVMGVILQSGLGAELSSLLLHVSEGNIYVLAVLVAVVCIVLGTGLPTIVVYILLATVVAPAMIHAGVPILAAHLFIFYYGVVALLTPPLAVAAYTAAGIAESDPNKTGFYAAWFALAKYAVPFMFLFSPALVGDGSWWEIVVKVTFAIFAMAAISLAVIGFWRRRVGIWSRLGFLVAAGLLGSVPVSLNLGGLAIFLLLGAPQVLSQRRAETISSQ